LSNQITPDIIEGAVAQTKDPKNQQPIKGEISPETRKAIIKEQKKDPYLSPLRQLMVTGKAPNGINVKTQKRIKHQKDSHVIVEGILRKIIREGHDTYSAVVIPQAFKQKILELHHDTPSMCHLGTNKTYKIMSV
jgi:hypothetical protein